MADQHDQWIRKCTLIVATATEGIDLSAFRIKFSIQNADIESPNNAAIRVYNLSQETVNKIRGVKGEYSRVILNAGYENGNFGVIFDGTIIQFRTGRESNKDTYLDILAADGDFGYNNGVVNMSVSSGTTPQQMIAAAAQSMKADGGQLAIAGDKQHTPSLRGAVLFGMARSKLRYLASSLDASWSIQNGKVNVVSFTGYLPGEAVEINRGTGMIGIPEQTEGGIRVQCLLNPKLRIGGLVKLNNDDFNQLMQRDPEAAALKYNLVAGFQYNTPLAGNGVYRAYVVEYEGDTRGREWYSNLICLAFDPTANQVVSGV